MKTKLTLNVLLPLLEQTLQDAVLAVLKKSDLRTETVEVKRVAAAHEKGMSLEEGSRTAIQYFTTRTLDRDNEILLPQGADMSQFRASNMQVFWNHDYHQLIGSDTAIKRDAFGWKAWTQYAEHADPSARANLVWELKQQGHLKTNSVGFAVLETADKSQSTWKPLTDKLMADWEEFTPKVRDNTARIITKFMVLEHSDVGLPSNIDSQVIAVAKNHASDADIEKMFNIDLKDYPTGDPKAVKDADDKAAKGPLVPKPTPKPVIRAPVIRTVPSPKIYCPVIKAVYVPPTQEQVLEVVRKQVQESLELAMGRV